MRTACIDSSPHRLQERFGCPRQPTVTEGVRRGEAGRRLQLLGFCRKQPRTGCGRRSGRLHFGISPGGQGRVAAGGAGEESLKFESRKRLLQFCRGSKVPSTIFGLPIWLKSRKLMKLLNLALSKWIACCSPSAQGLRQHP